ncbi:MAG: methyltransferase domain-containing protein [Alphaproteobacteria bacterium]|nr:methyltransferase domain-containing protein [Alphaproteobacteria bacterium]
MSETPDLFADKAQEWDSRPVPAQISQGVTAALFEHVPLDASLTVMDFGAGTGLICTQLAPRVGKVLAVDISEAMLEQLARKEALAGRAEIFCQDILSEPLGRTVDLVVSAMAMHHVQDTRALLAALFAHLEPGGRVALADLDKEDGDFHPPGIEGVFHAGFEREALAALLEDAGFEAARFVTACEVDKEGKRYPIFLAMASKPAA